MKNNENQPIPPTACPEFSIGRPQDRCSPRNYPGKFQALNFEFIATIAPLLRCKSNDWFLCEMKMLHQYTGE